MNNKSAIIITGILLIAGLSGEMLIGMGVYQFASVTPVLIALARICGVLLIMQLGTLIKERILVSLILIAAGITLIGTLFKITHAPKADLFLLTGLCGTLIIYTIHFLRKNNKNGLDFLKLLWVVAYCLASLLLYRHIQFGHTVKIAEGVLFLLLYIAFVRSLKRLPASGIGTVTIAPDEMK
jgi:hypothetical protein